MSTLIFRTVAPLITLVMLVFSAFVTLRGHNDPGGGFIGGLIAASAIAIYGIAMGPGMVARASGPRSLRSLWSEFNIGETAVALSTPMVFDIGVYFVVLGTISAIALALEDGGGES